MDLQLQDKRALVTGSSSGIGEAIAHNLAREGAIVVVNGRKESEVKRVVEEIKASGGKAFAAVGDLMLEDGARKVADTALSSAGGIDILINNAAKFDGFDRSWMEISAETWLDMYNVNVVSVVRLVHFLVPQMKQHSWGRIIQNSSSLAVRPFAFQPDYEASKAAMLNLTVSLSNELANTGITVNSVSPGLIATEIVKQTLYEMAESKGWGNGWLEIEPQATQEVWANPTGRLGTAEDVANCVTFLSSPLADYVNGVNLRIDGGGVGVIY